jgi:hypothetical protein
MNQDGKTLNARGKFLGRVSMLRACPFIAFLWIVAISLSGTRTLAETLVGDVELRVFMASKGTNSKPEFSSQAMMSLDLTGRDWLISYTNRHGKYVRSYQEDVLERPDYNGTNAWHIISPTIKGYPIGMDADDRLLWFAYMAAEFLRGRDGHHVILPYGNARLEYFVHACRMTSKWRKQSDLCPESAEFVFDREMLLNGTEELSLEPSGQYLLDRGANFDSFLRGHTNGQLIARFQVNQWADRDNVGLPIAWRFDLNWYGKPFYICTGTTRTSWIEPGGVNFPPLPAASRITDKRVRDVKKGINQTSYEVANGQMPTVAEVVVRPKDINPGFRQMPLESDKPQSPHAIIIGLLCVSIVLPIALFMLFRKGRASQ